MTRYACLFVLGALACSEAPPSGTGAVGGTPSSTGGNVAGPSTPLPNGGQETANTPGTPTSGVGGGQGGSSQGGASAPGGNANAGDATAGDGGASHATGPQNLAPSHCYVPGCTAMWANDPCSAFDGELNTVTGPAKTWDSALGALAVDFGRTQHISKLVVYYDDDHEPGVTFPSPGPGYTVDGSNDGQTWTAVRTVENPASIDTQGDLNASYRYMRVHFKLVFFDPWFVHGIKEIELWGMPGAAQ